MNADERRLSVGGLQTVGWGLLVAFWLSGCGEKSKAPEPHASISADVCWTNSSSASVWVEPVQENRFFGGCGVLTPHIQAVAADRRVKFERTNTVVWRFDTEKESSLRTNALDISAIPPGHHKGTLVIELTTNLTWRAYLAPALSPN